MQVLLQQEAMDGGMRRALAQGEMGGHASWATLPSFPFPGVPRPSLTQGQVCSGQQTLWRQPEAKITGRIKY